HPATAQLRNDLRIAGYVLGIDGYLLRQRPHSLGIIVTLPAEKFERDLPILGDRVCGNCSCERKTGEQQPMPSDEFASVHSMPPLLVIHLRRRRSRRWSIGTE